MKKLARIIYVLTIITVIGINLLPYMSVRAQIKFCRIGNSQLVALDGVDFQLCLPFNPDHSSVAENNDWVQTGAWIKENPYQEFTIYALPYGVNPAADNLPIAAPGITTLYKKTTLDLYKPDTIVSINGPSISIFGNSVAGATYILPDKNGVSPYSQKLVTEWIVEAGSRVWMIHSNLYGNFSDTSARKAALKALKNISLESRNLGNPSTSLAEHRKMSVVPPQSNDLKALGDLPTPKWWSGDCDVNNFRRSFALGAVYRGLKACGPLGTLHLVNFGAGVSQYEWQCAELPKRYLYLLYGIAPKKADGDQIVSVYANALPNLKKVANGTHNSGLAAGDIISYNTSSAAGHTAIITSVTIDANGNGSYTTIEQNYSSKGKGNGTISNWRLLSSVGGIAVYLHDTNGGRADGATFKAQSPYPVVNPGQTFSIFFELVNSGGTTWQSGSYWLQNIGLPLGAAPKQDVGNAVAPNGIKRWTINMIAPTTPGTYRTKWMVSHNGTNFGPYMFIDVTVRQPTTPVKTPTANVVRTATSTPILIRTMTPTKTKTIARTATLTPIPVPTNISVNRFSYAVCSESTSYPPSKGNDGSIATRWASCQTPNPWYNIDLGVLRTISTMTIRWETAYCTQFQINISPDDSVWTTYGTYSSSGGNQTVNFPNLSTRYISLYCVTKVNSAWGMSVWEWEIYGW